MANGDVYQLTFNSILYGQNCTNVFFYQQVEDDGDFVNKAEALLQTWRIQFLGVSGILKNAFFMTAWESISQRVINLYNPTELWSELDGGIAIGTQTVGGMPPFTAVGFKTPQKTRAIRRGQKRFPGVSEEHQAQGAWDADQITYLESLATYLGANMVATGASGDDNFVPCVVRRIFTGIVNGKRQYRLPETPAETDLFFATEWSYDPNVTSQNTRKIGRGI